MRRRGNRAPGFRERHVEAAALREASHSHLGSDGSGPRFLKESASRLRQKKKKRKKNKDREKEEEEETNTKPPFQRVSTQQKNANPVNPPSYCGWTNPPVDRWRINQISNRISSVPSRVPFFGESPPLPQVSSQSPPSWTVAGCSPCTSRREPESAPQTSRQSRRPAPCLEFERPGRRTPAK